MGEIMWVSLSHFSYKTPGLRRGCDMVGKFEVIIDCSKLCQETDDLYWLYLYDVFIWRRLEDSLT